MGNILIVDDDAMLAKFMASLIQKEGHRAHYCLTLADGLACAQKQGFDVVFLDVNMPDGNGLDAIIKLRELPPFPEVIVFTAAGAPDDAETALKVGAFDYIEKSPRVKEILEPLFLAIQYRDEKPSPKTHGPCHPGNIIGNSPKMKLSLDLLQQAAASEANTLITGETGVGKELFAKAIHENSRYASGNFVVVDCTSIPKDLFESLLFGHVKGAFTSADQNHNGLIGQADGGTLFLDEIGELPLDLQKKFLRVLEERRYRRVGGKRLEASDFRLIAATNKHLDSMVSEGFFRNDLLYRLRALAIDLPPLRERRDDIAALIEFHLDRLCRQYRILMKKVSQELRNLFLTYDWPGNVRELVNTIDATLSIAGNAPTLYCKHIPVHVRVQMIRKKMAGNPAADDGLLAGDIPKLKDFRESNDKKYLQWLLLRSEGKIKKAASLSGVSKSRLYELLAKHGIPATSGSDARANDIQSSG